MDTGRTSRRRSSRGRGVSVKVEQVPSNSAVAPETVQSEPTVTLSDNAEDVEDVTEEVKDQREREAKRKQEEEAVDLSSDEEDVKGDSDFDGEEESEDEGSDAWDDDVEEGDDEPVEEEEEDEPKKVRASKEAPLQVLMEEKDMPAAPGKPNQQENSTGAGLEEGSALVGQQQVDGAVKNRIIKLLNTGFHDQSNENEAKNAMKLAQKMMKKYNLSQAILLKERQEKNEKEQSSGSTEEILKGGIVKVDIFNRKTGKAAVMARWIGQLVHPICKNFDVKSYHSVRRGHRCEVAFYGIYTNCQLAAYAFKVATERISQMCDTYKPNPNQQTPIYPWEKKITTKSSRLSYGIGIVEGIDRDVDKNIRLEKEERERKMEKARMAANRGEAYDESDDDDDDDEGGAGMSFSRHDEEKVVSAFDPQVYTTSSDKWDDANVDTLFDHVDDHASSLSSLERVKRDLAKKIILLKKDDGPSWIKEQKAYWKEKLPKEEF